MWAFYTPDTIGLKDLRGSAKLNFVKVKENVTETFPTHSKERVTQRKI